MTLSGTTLTPTNVFAGLSVLNLVKSSTYSLPNIIGALIQTKISLSRIQDFLRAKDQAKYASFSLEPFSIQLKNANFV